MGAAGEILDGFKDAFLNLFQRTLGQAGQELLEAGNTVKLIVGVHGFCNAVTEKHERVAGLELEASSGVFGFGNQAKWVRAFREGFFGDSVAYQERRRIAGVGELEGA